MTKTEYLAKLASLYRAANTADTENKQEWMHVEMAGKGGCAAFDAVMSSMLNTGVISYDEHTNFYNSL